MRKAKVFFKGEEVGLLTQHDDGSFSFSYSDFWLNNSSKPGISLSLPKSNQEFHSSFLFPFFYNMLPEGSNRDVVCKHNRLDKTDYFGILISTANSDSIGAVTIFAIDKNELP